MLFIQQNLLLTLPEVHHILQIWMIEFCYVLILIFHLSLLMVFTFFKNNRFFYMFNGKIGRSSTIDRNLYVFQRVEEYSGTSKNTLQISVKSGRSYWLSQKCRRSYFFLYQKHSLCNVQQLTSNQNSQNKNVVIWLDEALSTDKCTCAHLYWK